MDYGADPLGLGLPHSSGMYTSSPIHCGGQSVWNPRTSVEQLLPLSPTKTLNPAPGSTLHRLSHNNPAPKES